MNAGHLEFCASAEWRLLLEELILPEALRDVDLGPDVIEIGPGPGFTTDVLRTLTQQLTAVELDSDLAASLARRLEGTNVTVLLGNAADLDLDGGRFSGAASFHMLHHIEADALQDRCFAELARVLRPGGVLVAADGLESEAVRAFHEGDIYNPIDPETLVQRLETAGFTSVQVRLHDLGWCCTARVRSTEH